MSMAISAQNHLPVRTHVHKGRSLMGILALIARMSMLLLTTKDVPWPYSRKINTFACSFVSSTETQACENIHFVVTQLFQMAIK